MQAYNMRGISELIIITAFYKTHRNISVLFPTKCRFFHYLVPFVSCNIDGSCKQCTKFKWPVKADCRHLNPDAKNLRLSNMTSIRLITWAKTEEI